MSNVEILITEHIDTWTSAVKIKSSAGRGSSKKSELYGIKKLRELILELAVRGLLVTQDKEGQPASVILDKIAAQKEKLIKDKVIKKQKKLSAISNDEVPFDLPENWLWARLGNTGICTTGKTPSTKVPENFDGNIPFIGPGQITPAGDLLEPEKYLSEQGMDESTEALPGDIFMVCIGGSIGKSVISTKRVAFNQQINAIRPLIIIPNYLNICVSARFFYNSVLDKATGSATPIINRGKWEELVVPICSLSQQQKNSDKVEELMALCDQLEQKTDASIDAHKTLVSRLLKALTDSAANSENGTEKFQQAWERITENFDVLFTTDNSIDQLKETILQLAVMGKLVPQDSKDEPASVLLEKIAAEKEQLIQDKKIKKQKSLPAITEDERAFELPKSWEWTKVGNLGVLKGGFAYKSKEFVESSDHQLIRMGNIRPDFLRINENPVFISEYQAKETEDYEIALDDILLTMTGTKGKRDYLYSLKISSEDLQGKSLYLNQRLCIIRPLVIEPSYINLVLKDDRLLDAIYAKSTGSANQANIGMDAIMNWSIPLPAFQDQKNIVKKVQELWEICDLLKARLSKAQSLKLTITDALATVAIA